MLIGPEFPGSPLVPGKPGGPRDPGRPGTAKPQRQKKKQSENCVLHDFHFLSRLSSAAVALINPLDLYKAPCFTFKGMTT